VGNVLNSVNVSATIMVDKIRNSEVGTLGKVRDLMAEHQPDLATFLTNDDRGKMIPAFIAELADCLGQEQTAMLAEVESLSKGIDHIKQIVAAQQSTAKKTNVRTKVKPSAVLESAIAIQGAASMHDIDFRRNYTECPEVMLDQHKVLQILINLVRNAGQAVIVRPAGQRQVTLSVAPVQTPEGEYLRYQVTDNGIGIAPEHLTRIFSHGFTTKQDGHGFGLHSAANAAKEMGGSLTATSNGPGKGAVFTLDLPLHHVEETTACQ